MTHGNLVCRGIPVESHWSRAVFLNWGVWTTLNGPSILPFFLVIKQNRRIFRSISSNDSIKNVDIKWNNTKKWLKFCLLGQTVNMARINLLGFIFSPNIEQQYSPPFLFKLLICWSLGWYVVVARYQSYKTLNTFLQKLLLIQ